MGVRYSDDWVVTCRTRAEARAALDAATRILGKLGVTLQAEKTRIVHIRYGFEFLGYKIKRGSRPLRLAPEEIRAGARPGALYAYPRILGTSLSSTSRIRFGSGRVGRPH